jgi:putative acetyltransferase
MNTPILKRTNSSDPDFSVLIHELDRGLRESYGDLMNIYDGHNVIEKIDTVVIAYMADEPVGCGCFKNFDKQTVEIKRMYVRPQQRGNGISTLILKELENWAHAAGYSNSVLETGSKQLAALAVYKKFGYMRIPDYGPYINLPDSLCFGKSLG